MGRDAEYYLLRLEFIIENGLACPGIMENEGDTYRKAQTLQEIVRIINGECDHVHQAILSGHDSVCKKNKSINYVKELEICINGLIYDCDFDKLELLKTAIGMLPSYPPYEEDLEEECEKCYEYDEYDDSDYYYDDSDVPF